jgi:phosphoglycolate phosphatase-like HAD superfamily hydrolase
MPSRHTFILFDVDGTLVDSMGLEEECFSGAVLDHLGVDSIDTDWSSYRHTTDPGILNELYERLMTRLPTATEVEAFQDLFVGKLAAAIAGDPNRCREIRGARNLIAMLRQSASFAVGIATGAWQRPISLKLKAADVDIDGLPFASGDDAFDRRSIFEIALKRAASSFGRVVVVGDGVWDVDAARSIGAAFVGLGSGERADRLIGAGATDVIADYQDISNTIARIEGAKSPA